MKIELELGDHEHLPLPLKELIREVSKLKFKIVVDVERQEECDNE